LSKRWPAGHFSFRNEAFGNYAKENVFERFPPGLPGANGQIAVHAQFASFRLDCSRMHPDHPDYYSLSPGCNPTIIRLSNNRIAGSINLDAFAAQTLRRTNQQQGHFIALSTCGGFQGEVSVKESSMYEEIQSPSPHISPSIFYGCPCSDSTTSPIHVVECPKHVDFYRPCRAEESDEERYEDELDDVHTRADSNHVADLSYFDVHGALLHPTYSVPTLKVMLVVPNREGYRGHTTYKRLGLGQIYLKRWVEASPTFETIVLE
jgi:hypothetical protein